MLFHVSIEADQPRHVASVIAELWRGKALPFPPVGVGSWVAFAGDDRATILEVYPRGTVLNPGDDGAIGVASTPHRYNATHAAIATPLEINEVLAIARREGWPAKICWRSTDFRVIELWIEGCQMMELLTAEMQREYLDTVSIENWERLLASHAALATA